MSNSTKELALKTKSITPKQVGNALLNNALIIIMLLVAAYVAVTQPSFLAPNSLINLLSLTAAYLRLRWHRRMYRAHRYRPFRRPCGGHHRLVWQPPCCRPPDAANKIVAPTSAPCPSPW